MERLSTLKKLPLRFFARDERGVTAVEYGLLCVGIALVLFTVISSLGQSVSNVFGNIGANL